MQAYIDTHYAAGRGFYCDVVTEQDYHDGGPHARSHRTEVSSADTAAEAEGWASEWAKRNGYEVTNCDAVAGA
jgi:hypothetical protein